MSGTPIPERPASRPNSGARSGDLPKPTLSPELADRFRGLLNSAERKLSPRAAKTSDGPPLMLDALSGKGPVRSKAGRSQDDEQSACLLDASPLLRSEIAAARDSGLVVTAGAVLPDDLHAHVERMAAAISESLGHGHKDVFTIQFPAGQALAHAALVSRSETGAIHIRLLPADGAISVQSWAVARQSLVARLQQRRISVGDVTLDGVDDDPSPETRHRISGRGGR